MTTQCDVWFALLAAVSTVFLLGRLIHTGMLEVHPKALAPRNIVEEARMIPHYAGFAWYTIVSYVREIVRGF